jgi:membrane protease YdiL (CAAX protease family)
MTPPDVDAGMFEQIRRRILIGLGLAGALALALTVGTDLGWTGVVGIPLFGVVFPTLAVAQAPLTRILILDREEAYLSSGKAILVLGGIAMALVALGPGLELAGLQFLPFGTFVIWTAGLLVAALLLSVSFEPLERRLWRRSPSGTLEAGLMDALMPRTPEERRLFAGLSLSAGWGEEMAYRGYLPAALVVAGLPVWWAMGAAAAVFGLLHTYQGPSGVVRTAAVGFLLGSSVILTESIFPAMAAHALLDLVLGLVLGPRILRARDERGAA